MESSELKRIKSQIVSALRHPEAQDGLYFDNLWYLHEEDERPAVTGEQVAILDALKELINEGQVKVDETGKEVIFMLSKAA